MDSNEIESTYSRELLWGLPVKYKGIDIHPVKCEHLHEFYYSVYCLLYNPLRYIGEISTLPRLYFLTDIINHFSDQDYLSQNTLLLQMFIQLRKILELVLHDQIFDFEQKNNKWFLYIVSDGQQININAREFENIRRIILVQNGMEYDDTFIHDDILNWIAKQEKNEKSPTATIEDHIEAFIMETGQIDEDGIKKLSIRRFNRILGKIIARENYTIQATASMSGFVTFKGKIDHWLTVNKKNSIYDKYFNELK